MITCEPWGRWWRSGRALLGTCERRVMAPREQISLDRCGGRRPREAGHLDLAPGHLGASERLASQGRVRRRWLSPDLVPRLPPQVRLFFHLMFWKPASSVSRKTFVPVCLSAHGREVQRQLSGLLAKPCWEQPPASSEARTVHFKEAGSFLPQQSGSRPPAHLPAAFPWQSGGCSSSLAPES